MIHNTTHRKTDFCILGAPKCGTYSMHIYLDQHPNISVLTKEIHLFGTDINYIENRFNEQSFLDQITERIESKLIGESAVWYLKSKDALLELKEYNPNLKLIVQLRNPAEACYSMWSNMNYNGNDPLSFEEALEQEENRSLPSYYTCPDLAFTYRKTFEYAEQLERLFSIFPKEQVCVIQFDDLKSQPDVEYKRVLELLDEDTSFQPEFVIHNANKEVKSEKMRSFITQPNKTVKSVIKGLIPSKAVRESLKKKATKANTRFTERPKMDSELQLELIEYFRPNVERVEQILNLDLSHWK